MTAAAGWKLQVHQQGSLQIREMVAEACRMPGVLTTMLRSMVDAWPDAVYTDRLFETRILGQRAVFVCDPALIRQLLVDEADALEREAVMSRALEPALGSGLLTADGAHWRGQRRITAPMFHPGRVRSFVPAMAEAAAVTRARWLERPEGASFDLQHEMMRTTLDIVVATMVSGDGSLDGERFGAAMEHYLGQTNWKIAYASLGLPAWTPHPGSRAGARAARYLRESVGRMIADRRARGGGGRDLLGLLIEARDPETGRGVPDSWIVDNLITFVAAGHETTALALTWCLRLLADHPAVETRLRSEIASQSLDLRADPAGIDRLPYARQVVQEAMRLFPPAPLLVRRTIRPIRLGGTTIPAGRAIHVPIYALHRHRRLWERPDLFDPDRFDPAEAAGRDRYAYLPFGAGPRICIGMGLALTECMAVLAELLPSFSFQTPSPEMPATRFRVTLRPHGGMPMTVTPRRSVH